MAVKRANSLINKTSGKAYSVDEYLSFAINNVAGLGDIDLPIEGVDNLSNFGSIIMNNYSRYRNAFINAVNMIAFAVITKGSFENPWKFAYSGDFTFGSSVEELDVNPAEVFNYQEYRNNPTGFLNTVIPDIKAYIHNLNVEVFYKVTLNDTQISMAFNSESNFIELIDYVVDSLYTAYEYDNYILLKYILCRRAVDGTLTPSFIENYDTLDDRKRVSAMKAIANNMSFMSANFNPAGRLKATPFDNQMFLLNTTFEADLSTVVLSQSYFRDDAQFKSQFRMFDSLNNWDNNRLRKILGETFKPFTQEELNALNTIPAFIISDDFFKWYDKQLNTMGNRTEFFNPETLDMTNWLHKKSIMSSSPFANATVFVTTAPQVNNVVVTPATATLNTVGSTLQLTATVDSVGFANKSCVFSVAENQYLSCTPTGLVTLLALPENGAATVSVTATSIFDSSKTATCQITINNA